MKKVTAICPGSCGELIQGFIKGKKLLVSLPIEMYAKVTVKEGQGNHHQLLPKMRSALQETLKRLDISNDVLERLNFSFYNDLPKGKGMASSTADIGSLIKAVAKFLGEDLSISQIASIALSIEPTDSVLFDKLTLFDYIEGSFSEEIGLCPELNIVILEGYGGINTVEFNQNNSFRPNPLLEKEMDKAYFLLQKGIKELNYELLGQGSLISARINQQILEKVYLENLIETAMKNCAAGINVAHSGTVTGVLVDPEKGDPERIKAIFSEEHWKRYFQRVYITKTVSGGAKVIDE